MNNDSNRDLASIRLDSSLVVLSARGADTDTFLQGQLSNDLRKLDSSSAQLSSYNSPKGRMLAVLTLTRREDGVDLELPRGLLESFSKRLRMFVLRSKVQLVESADSILGLRGDRAIQALTDAGLPAPGAALGCASSGELRVTRRLGPVPRYTIRGPAGLIDKLAERWATSVPLTAAQWMLDDVLAGVPLVLPETQDRFVAQMANLDQVGGISFDKGCYTGQEIVARLHYLGQLKRRMFLCQGDGIPPPPGSEVHDGEGEQAVGDVVLSAPRPAGGFAASVVLQISHAQSAALHIGDVALSTPEAFTYYP